MATARQLRPSKRPRTSRFARRRQENESAWNAYVHEVIDELAPSELERLAAIVRDALSIEERDRLLRARLEELERERQSRTDALHDDWSSAVGQGEAEFVASLAEDGFTHANGEALGLGDFIEDDGKGYDRL